MSLSDTYRNNINRKRNEIMKLREDRSKEIKKISDINLRIKRSSETMRKTNSQSTYRRRLRIQT